MISNAEHSDNALLHEFFARSAACHPQRMAVEVPPGPGRAQAKKTTYAELDRWSDALARQLRTHVRGECVVAILLPRRGANLYAAQLAVLKSGAAYTCVDQAYPDERIGSIIEDAAPVALLTDSTGLARAAAFHWGKVPLVRVDETPEPADAAPSTEGPAWLSPASLAYVIYTSGTTGRPKGVLIEHRSIANLVAADRDEFQLSPADRVVQGSSPAYDSSLEETWLAFAAGATLVVMDDDAVRSGPDLVDWLRRERVTVFCPPPTLLRATGCQNPTRELPDLRLLYVGGEPLPQEIADRWAPGRLLVNGYGPTECTVTALRGAIHAGEPVHIGRPTRGLQAWVLDDSLEPVAIGQVGELCLGGVGLARAYWRRPELTAGKFIAHPRLGRLYRTGDLAHRDGNGLFFHHGRNDAQVKVRGHRIELEEIEAQLALCPGVRAAACRVQGDARHAALVAFIVPQSPAEPPPAGALRAHLAVRLPDYMVPTKFSWLRELPTTTGGKLSRAALPRIDDAENPPPPGAIAPRNPAEAWLAAAFAEVLHRKQPVSVTDDFFQDLGGDSLTAAELITLLRENPTTASLAVRDLYEARTVAGLVPRAVTPAFSPSGKPVAVPRSDGAPRWHPALATTVQLAALAAIFAPLAVLGYYFGVAGPIALARQLGLGGLVMAAPILAALSYGLYLLLSVSAAVTTKWLLIGRYRAGRTAVWSAPYLRGWMVERVVRLVPWSAVAGTEVQLAILRLLGARIGARVHLDRGIDLYQGGWDLLVIGNDVSIGRDVTLRLVELEAGDRVIGPITIGDGATLEARAGLGPDTTLEAGAYLRSWSSLPAGGRIPAQECWSGIPASPAGAAPLPPMVPTAAEVLSPWQYARSFLWLRTGIDTCLALPVAVLGGFAVNALGLQVQDMVGLVLTPTANPTAILLALATVVMVLPLSLVAKAAVIRLLDRVPEGTASRWSHTYLRAWLKIGLVEAAGDWLAGTLFWPAWLRLAGMKVGCGCEISTIMDVVPEHLEIRGGTFFADGIYLGGPLVHRGVVVFARTRLGRNNFLGNHVVIPAGQQLPDNILLGVCTVADDRTMEAGSSWFGHPPMRLPRREIVAMDRSLTHAPSAIRYWNRVFWEALRFALPAVPALTAEIWFSGVILGQARLTGPVFFWMFLPALTAGLGFTLCLLLVALKWLLLGRVRPGQHAFWSCWCSRWDFLYVAWEHLARPLLTPFSGTLLLNWYLRAMGMSIGRGVVLGPGFTQVVDPDMITIEDGATVNALFQVHTFEDRVLKIDRAHIGAGATLGMACVPLYGARIGAGTVVAAHSVIMKREHLLAGQRYEGAPTSPCPAARALSAMPVQLGRPTFR